MAVSLPRLFAKLPGKAYATIPHLLVTGVAHDSRQVAPGNLFVAIKGELADGHGYISQAIRRGAAVVVGTEHLKDLGVPYIRVEDSRLTLAHLAAAYYDFPAKRMTVIGITGTDGKTTTANLIYQILVAEGIPTGMITTVNAIIGDQQLDTGFHVTTPEAPDVQKYLSLMTNAGLNHVILEATSHGLSQHRVAGCEFDIGVVTNITHEHLDFHGSYEAYREAKGLLFKNLINTEEKAHQPPRLAVLNHDDESFNYLSHISEVTQVTYGSKPPADLYAADVVSNIAGLEFTAIGPEFKIPVKTRLVGRYNVANCLAAIAVTGLGLKVSVQGIEEGIAMLRGVPGRMERINIGQDFLAIVDFAHTPNALKRSLMAARELTKGRIFAIFGSAGLRDREKRRMMAEVSMDLADVTVLTAEDPRTESLDDILEEMAEGARAKGGVEGETFFRVPDRGNAIRYALKSARVGDVVIACGKGHEQSMCFGDVEYPWDDRTAMKAGLSELLGLKGPEMPSLPTAKQFN